VAAVVCAGCIKLADFHPGNGSGSPDAHTADAAPPGECGNGVAGQATASMSGTAICASGPNYALRFPASSFHYPDQLRIGTSDVLSTSTACNEESLVGMDLYPVSRFSSDSAATGETASATIILAGPVVAKVAVSWSWQAAAQCAPSRTVTGHSSFTLFPDGRLVRFDELTTPSASSQTPCDCDTAAQGFLLTAYVTLVPSVMITNQGGDPVFPSTGEGMAMPALVCASSNGWAIGIAEQLVGRARNATGGGIALTTDLDASGATSLSSGSRSTVTAYQIGTAGCAPLFAPIAQFTSSTGPQLRVRNTMGFDDTIGTQRDGMYGGDNGTGTGLPTGAGTLTLSTTSDPIPAGWALAVSGTTLLPPTATPPRTGDWYRIQNGTNDSIIWFRDGLTSTDTITVPTP
jgi:hypothetical protein